MEVNPNMTFAQAVVISQAVSHWKFVQMGILNATHATEQEKAEASRQIKLCNEVLN